MTLKALVLDVIRNAGNYGARLVEHVCWMQSVTLKILILDSNRDAENADTECER